MKKIKKIASIVLGLLSSVSFKSAAMGKNYGDALDDELDLDINCINDDVVSSDGLWHGGRVLPVLYAIPVVSIAIGGGFIHVRSGGAVGLVNSIPVERKALNLYGDAYLNRFKNSEIITEFKNELTEGKKGNSWIFDCTDKLIKYTFCYFLFMKELLAECFSALNVNEPKKIDVNNILFNLEKPDVIGLTSFLQKSSYLGGDSASSLDVSYMSSIAMAVLRSSYELANLKLIDGKIVVEGDKNFKNVVSDSFDIFNRFLCKNENNYRNDVVAMKKFHSWMAYCLGLNLWKELYPNKEYDEEEYLRLQKQLCIM